MVRFLLSDGFLRSIRCSGLAWRLAGYKPRLLTGKGSPGSRGGCNT